MLPCSIIIPVFNHSDLTRQCLEALQADGTEPSAREIIIVNDGSTDDTLVMLAGYGAQVRVITLTENQGFAAACNAGAAAAQGEYVVFLNNDTLPRLGWLAALQSYQVAHPHVAALGARLLFPDGTVQHAGVVIGQDRNPWHLYAGFPGDHPAVCRSRRFQIVTGACLWMRRELFQAVGGFDTGFRNGFEDVDLCLRLGAQGHEIHYCHECVIVHLESQTRGGWTDDDTHNHALYRERWDERIKPDDLSHYLADGTLKTFYGQRQWLMVDDSLNAAYRPTRPLRIGMCGTFDVENYGDLLFPLLAEAELKARLGECELHLFSYHAQTAEHWPFAVRSVAELPEAIQSLDGLLIGGGHLIRFGEAVAPGYAPPAAHIHHPTGYWLTPALLALQHGKPVVWNAPGLHDAPPAWAVPLLKLALSQSQYVAVRDEATQQALRLAIGDDWDCEVVPDTAFGAARLVNREKPSTDWQAWCKAHRLDKSYVIVQATALNQSWLDWLTTHAADFAEYQWVLLPLGPALGDAVEAVRHSLANVIEVREWPTPLLLTELIAHAAGVVGPSLHLGIVATAFGVPVLRPTSYWNEKYRILSPFASVLAYDDPAALSVAQVKAHWAATSPAAQLDQINHQFSRQLRQHWDTVARTIHQPTSGAARQALNQFWQTLPQLLVASGESHAAEQAAQAQVLADKPTAAQRNAADYAEPLAKLKRFALSDAEKLAQLKRAEAERTEQLAKLKRSYSWRLTRPLRQLMRKLRGWPTGD